MICVVSVVELVSEENKDVKVFVVGVMGYIGKYVMWELCVRGYDVTAFTREKSGIGGKTNAMDVKVLFLDVKVKFGDVGSKELIEMKVFDEGVYDVVVLCLVSRTGGVKDSWDIDYRATKNVLDVVCECGSKYFVLLSVICV